MAATTPGAEGKLRFDDPAEIEDTVQRKLKRRYGRGIHIHNYRQSSDGTVFIQLGTTVPKDVSDCRAPDRALKFIKYAPIHTLEAEPLENGYLIELPDRAALAEGLEAEKADLASRLDRSMAKTIYEQLIEFTPVENQLAALKEILRTVREHPGTDVETIHEIRGPTHREQTTKYLELLQGIEFIRIAEDDEVYPGRGLDAHDVKRVDSTEFGKVVLGQVINQAYHTLKDDLNMTLLAHYPKYANAYYFSALERDDPNLRLNAEAAKENLADLYDEDQHPIKVQQKLDDLAEVGVLEKEDGFYRSNADVFNSVREQAAV